MGQTISILVFIIIAFLVVWYLYRSAQSPARRVLSGEKSLDDKDIWLRFTKPLPARILSKKETIKPEATGIAKVDLELEIQMPEGEPYKVDTTWLVEIPSVPQLEVGNMVEVKFDPKKPGRVFPAVPWARLWVFGK
jgi:hypothetical protein